MDPGNSTFSAKKHSGTNLPLWPTYTCQRKFQGLGVPLFLFHITSETIKTYQQTKLKKYPTFPLWRLKILLTGLAAYPRPIWTVEITSVQGRGAAGWLESVIYTPAPNWKKIANFLKFNESCQFFFTGPSFFGLD